MVVEVLTQHQQLLGLQLVAVAVLLVLHLNGFPQLNEELHVHMLLVLLVLLVQLQVVLVVLVATQHSPHQVLVEY